MQAGESKSVTIVCPSPPAQPTEVDVRVSSPDDLAREKLSVAFSFDSLVRPIGHGQWRRSIPMHEGNLRSVRVVSDGTIFHSQERISDVVARLPREMKKVAVDLHEELPGKLTWPGSGYLIRVVEVRLDRSALKAQEGSAVVIEERSPYAMSFLARDWQYTLEPDSPAMLRITPPPPACDTLRCAIAKVDEQRLANFETYRKGLQRLRPEPKVPAESDATADPGKQP